MRDAPLESLLNELIGREFSHNTGTRRTRSTAIAVPLVNYRLNDTRDSAEHTIAGKLVHVRDPVTGNERSPTVTLADPGVWRGGPYGEREAPQTHYNGSLGALPQWGPAPLKLNVFI